MTKSSDRECTCPLPIRPGIIIQCFFLDTHRYGLITEYSQGHRQFFLDDGAEGFEIEVLDIFGLLVNRVQFIDELCRILYFDYEVPYRTYLAVAFQLVGGRSEVRPMLTIELFRESVQQIAF